MPSIPFAPGVRPRRHCYSAAMATTSTFEPGAYWTPTRAAAAEQRMRDVLASPEVQAMMAQAAEGDDPAAAAAAMFDAAPGAATSGKVELEHCRFRRGEPRDLPRLVQLIAGAHLPPMFIEEFLPGFAIVEHDGEVVGCGGLELYDEGCGVIRSIVVDEPAKGIGLGRRITELLIDDARAFGATDLYLFTMDAWDFWRHMGFVDVPLGGWKMPPRVSWQYQFMDGHPEFAGQIHSMWRRA